MSRKPNPLFATDFYKIGHINQYNKLTTMIFSNFTPRADKLFQHYVENAPRAVLVAGIQGVIQSFVMDLWNDGFFKQPKAKVVGQYKRLVDKSLNVDLDVSHIEALHDLGYLPLEIRCLPEGTLCPIQVPIYTVYNTHDDFAWLTNYFESGLSAETWKVITNATTAFNYRLLFERYAEKTCDNNLHVDFQGHDFAFRGLSGIYDGYGSSFGHILAFKGTDTVLAIQYAEDFYGAEDTFVAGSIPASEHSVATTNIGAIIEDQRKHRMTQAHVSLDDERYFAEKEFLNRYITEIYPAGFVSYVADSYDYWSVLTKIAPELKDKIMAREGRLVFRPDSGDPVKVVAGYIIGQSFETKEEAQLYYEQTCNFNNLPELVKVGGEYFEIQQWDPSRVCVGNTPIPEHEAKGSVEVLWEIFGGEVNSKGYKVLDTHVGVIYGDSITLKRATDIFERLEAKGFSSSNIVFGIGSYTYNYNTRDTFGFACKATGSIINGEEILVSKEPKTDVKKKSAKGFLSVVKDSDGDYRLVDGLSFEDIFAPENELAVVFRDGDLKRFQNLEEVRDNVSVELKKYL